jgi:hypothetical protein
MLICLRAQAKQVVYAPQRIQPIIDVTEECELHVRPLLITSRPLRSPSTICWYAAHVAYALIEVFVHTLSIRNRLRIMPKLP